MTDYAKIKAENEKRNAVMQRIATRRIAKLENWIASYNGGMITADEFVKLTDSILSDELKNLITK